MPASRDRPRRNQAAAAIASAAPRASPAIGHRRLAGVATGLVTSGGGASAGAASASMAPRSSAALCQRSAGRFSRQRMTSAASADGTLARAWASGGAAWVSWAAMIAWGEDPVNGGRPARIS